jgi:hypothetical protein
MHARKEKTKVTTRLSARPYCRLVVVLQTQFNWEREIQIKDDDTDFSRFSFQKGKLNKTTFQKNMHTRGSINRPI